MSLWGSLWTAYGAAQEATGAVSAARDALASGQSVARALDAFCAHTATPLDDQVVADVHLAAEYALTALRTGVSTAVAVAGWLDEHRAGVVAGADAVAQLAAQLPPLVDRATAGAAIAGRYLTVAQLRLEALAT